MLAVTLRRALAALLLLASSRNNQAPWRGVTTFDPLLLATPPCSGHNQYVRKKRAFRKMAALPALLALGLSVAALANVEAAKPIPTTRRPRAASAVKSFGGRTSAWGLRSTQTSEQRAAMGAPTASNLRCSRSRPLWACTKFKRPMGSCGTAPLAGAR